VNAVAKASKKKTSVNAAQKQGTKNKSVKTVKAVVAKPAKSAKTTSSKSVVKKTKSDAKPLNGRLAKQSAKPVTKTKTGKAVSAKASLTKGAGKSVETKPSKNKTVKQPANFKSASNSKPAPVKPALKATQSEDAAKKKSTVAAAKKTASKPATPVKIAAKPAADSPKPIATPKIPPKPPEPPTSPKVLKRIRQLQQERESTKDLSFRPTLIKPPGANEPIWEKEPEKDRIALLVRDAYWIHATWDITRRAIERARAAMAEQWHTAKPTLRFLTLDNSSTTNTSETIERDIPIHGGIRNWYIDIGGKSGNFRAMIGYLSAGGRFHTICESNIVEALGAGNPESVDQHWTDMGENFEHVYAMSGGYHSEHDTADLKEMMEDRLHKTVGAPAFAQFGAGADAPFSRRGGFHFEMEVELVAYGQTVPDGYVTLSGEPVKLRPDGTFVVRLPFPDRRQVLPALATSRDGSHQRTIVVAVERNTKIMEPFSVEVDEAT